MAHLRLVLLALLAVLVPAPGAAAPTDFNFKDVSLSAIAQTIAVMGKFNVLVAPDLTEKVTFHRKGVEPLEALQELAQLASATVREVKDDGLLLLVVTRKPLPDTLATPAALPNQLPTDFNFDAVELKLVAQTMAVLGKSDAAVAPPLDQTKLTLSLKQVIPSQALYWVAAVSGGSIEESTSAAGRKLLMIKPRP